VGVVRPGDRQVVAARERHAEDDDVAGHVGDEDTVEAEVADRVDDPGGEGQDEQQHELGGDLGTGGGRGAHGVMVPWAFAS
jgi:hypothetical protein